MKCVHCCRRDVGAEGDEPLSETHVSVRWDYRHKVYDAEGLMAPDAERPAAEVDAANGWAIRYTTWPPTLITCPSCGTHDVAEAQVEHGTYRIERAAIR